MLLVLWVQTGCTGRSLCQIDRDAERRGTSVAPILAQADDNLETCAKLGRSPQKPYSGKIMLRVDPAIHARAAAAAEAQGKSLNAWAQELLQKAVTV